MKKWFRALCLIISLVMLIGAIPVSAQTIIQGDQTMYDEMDKYEFSYDNSNGNVAAIKSYNSQYPMSGNYYDQLDIYQKKVYSAILASPITATSVSVSFDTPITFSLSYLPTSGSDDGWAPIGDAVIGGYFSLIFDCPERFWYFSCGYSWNYSYSQDGSTYTFYISSVTISIGFQEAYSPSTITSVYANLLSAVNSFKPKGVTRYEKLRSIHDYIVNLADYDTDFSHAYAHQPTGCLLSPYICVCEGYAEAFKLFCDKLGIPCVLVVSSDHIWDVVLMEDNKWYAIDCTWNDQTPSGYVFYDFFLVGSTTVANHFGSETFGAGHVEDPAFTSSTGVSLRGPTLSTTAYSKVSVAYNSTNGAIDENRNIVILKPNTTITGVFLPTSDIGTVTNTGSATGKTLTYALLPGTEEIYNVVMYGDLDKDADCDASDFSVALDVAVGNVDYDSTDARTYAGDINGDGVVDGFDAALIDLYRSGHYTF